VPRFTTINKVVRLVGDLLRGKTHDRETLATRLDVTVATADRLLRAVSVLPGVRSDGDGRRRSLSLEPTLSDAPAYPTAIAACFGASLGPIFEGSTYERGLREALEHVIRRTRRRTKFRHLDRKFWFVTHGGEPILKEQPSLLDDLVDALMEHRVVTMTYQHFEGDEETLKIRPLSIVVHDRHIYLVARSSERAAYPYRLARIRSVETDDETFTYPTPAEYDPRQVFRDSFGIFVSHAVEDIEVRLHPRWKHYVERHRWHDSQDIKFGKDTITVLLRVRNCPELRTWILGFGDEAEVVRPVSLRDEVARRAEALARKYQVTGP
jgi:predicted DNA-binding transcriptional regulator YafY